MLLGIILGIIDLNFSIWNAFESHPYVILEEPQNKFGHVVLNNLILGVNKNLYIRLTMRTGRASDKEYITLRINNNE